MSILDSFAWQIAQISHQKSQFLLVITANNHELNALREKVSFFHPHLNILEFPDWETLPYDHISPPSELVTQRLLTLSRLNQQSHGIIITTVTALAQRLAPRQYIESRIFQFSKQDQLDITALEKQLAHSGYQRVSQVRAIGEFAVRGSVLDAFAVGARLPFRLDLDMDKIENLWYFDPETQLTKTSCEQIRLIPPREFPHLEENINYFKVQWASIFGEDTCSSPVYQQLRPNTYPPGIEYYLPLFFEKTETLFDYLPSDTQWVSGISLNTQFDHFWQQLERRYEQLKFNKQRPILPPSQLYQMPSNLLEKLHHLPKLSIPEHLQPTALPSFANSQALKIFLETHTNRSDFTKILFCTPRPSQRENIIQALAKINYHPKFAESWMHFLETNEPVQITLSPLQNGFWLKNEAIIVIPAHYILLNTSNAPQAKHPSNSAAAPHQAFTLSQLLGLKKDAPVVHIDHGIGRYLGLEVLSTGEYQTEFITLAYANDTKLYVPITDIDQISPYRGQENPVLNALNTESWRKTKKKALSQLKDTAAELLEIYAKRAHSKGFAFKPPNEDYIAFANACGFETTPDQTKAIEHVIHDLCDNKPMDRLVCGDVGFGKTEVAMRAAFLAVQSGKQVAVLAPTTLLVDQHYRNFRDRFADWPITIEWLSRFRTSTENRIAQKNLAEGHVDIIIGTHALLSKKIQFKNLGLLIVDEEHHFGVQQKERLKSLKKEIDVLTLTATPIPRTLQSTLSGLRELSIIATPPIGRLPIQTFITPREPTLIREAILRELSRGGQVYFVHNHIVSLERVIRDLKKWVPEAHIIAAHGQLPEHELEERMTLFYQQHYNVLVCTSIIETGLDIPTANTLIVDRADHFGLAQLHQLRGRVGRSRHQAYAYFLTPHEAALTSQAKKRLEALGALTHLGSGFSLATHDLDIRGAGELLGEHQSGVIKGVGFSLYMELLEQTIEALKKGESVEEFSTLSKEIRIDLQLPAFIPSDYIPDVGIRLQYYKRLSQAKNLQELNTIQLELIEKRGMPPQQVHYLFELAELKWHAKFLSIQILEAGKKGGWIEFKDNLTIDPLRIIQLVQQDPKHFKLETNGTAGQQQRLKFIWDTSIENEHRIEAVKKVLTRLEKENIY
jgi:transcription-repair coupling factor (superfamily II helicase)